MSISIPHPGGEGAVGVSTQPGGGRAARYERELREPLVWLQGSQVSMCVARGSALLLSSHGRGDVEKGLSKSFSGYFRKLWVPSTCASDLRQLLREPLRIQGYCGVGRGLSGHH